MRRPGASARRRPSETSKAPSGEGALWVFNEATGSPSVQ